MRLLALVDSECQFNELNVLNVMLMLSRSRRDLTQSTGVDTIDTLFTDYFFEPIGMDASRRSQNV